METLDLQTLELLTALEADIEVPDDEDDDDIGFFKNATEEEMARIEKWLDGLGSDDN